MKLRPAVCGLTLLLAAGCAAAQDRDFSKVVIESQQVADGVFMLTGSGGNIGASIGDDGIVIIDDQFAPLSERIQAALAKLSPKPVRFVINTHHHFDHTGGNENFGKGGSIIVAHENVRRHLSQPEFMKMLNQTLGPTPKEGLPIVTFTQDVDLHLNGEDLHIFHVANAHTDGDGLVIFRKANVIHMGDTFFNGFYPFIDVEGGGSIDGMISAADLVLKLVNDQTRIIPGHGPLATPPDLVKFRDMLKAIRANVAKLIKQGKTLEQTVAAAPSRDLDEAWGNGFLKPEVFVTGVYNDLKRTVK